MALAPKILRNLEKDITAVDLPVYLVPNADGKLTGGLQLSWNSKDEDIVFGVFIGAPLDALSF